MHDHDIDALYHQRLTRYITAMRNGQPDRVSTRPLAAEITAKCAGFTCQLASFCWTRLEKVARRSPNYDGHRWARLARHALALLPRTDEGEAARTRGDRRALARGRREAKRRQAEQGGRSKRLAHRTISKPQRQLRVAHPSQMF